MKLCIICGETKELDKFQSNGYHPSGKKKFKPNCAKCTNRIRLDDKYSKILQVLEDTNRRLECEMCGYKKNWAAIHFHHLDPSEKEFSMGTIRSSISYDRIFKEIEKCVILCANCHAEEHNPQCEIVVDEN